MDGRAWSSQQLMLSLLFLDWGVRASSRTDPSSCLICDVEMEASSRWMRCRDVNGGRGVNERERRS